MRCRVIFAHLVRRFVWKGYGEPIWDKRRREQRCGQAADKPWAESPSSLHGCPLRLARMRCERGLVGVVLASAPVQNNRERVRACGSLDWIFIAPFAEAVAWKDDKLSRLGRVIMRREPLEEFAKRLFHSDIVVIEAAGNAASVAAVIGPHVSRVVIANPKQVRLIAHAKIKTDKIAAGVLARLYASGFLCRRSESLTKRRKRYAAT
jgi:hypothetical protein